MRRRVMEVGVGWGAASIGEGTSGKETGLGRTPTITTTYPSRSRTLPPGG